ncbi:MAG: helix-turn-helix domain-containing protein [Clostridiales bacterium]|nr:helix-turn-helix domain-containing protein [Clostridiales bacterium]
MIYIHPAKRYCTVRYQDGITDTVQMAPADKVVSEQPVGSDKPHYVKKTKRNIWVRQALDELHVTQNAVAAVMGISKSALSNLLGSELTYDEQDEIVLAAERVAERQRTGHAD